MRAADVLSGGRQWSVEQGDCIDVMRSLPDGCVHCCVTSPPYFALRDYGVPGQIGLEETPEAFVGKLVEVFAEVRRVLRDDGTLWLNLGDSYNAYNGNRGRSTSFSAATEDACPDLPGGFGLTVKHLKPKDLLGIPWRVAFALQADGWYLRAEVIWHKRAPMPESVRDRPTRAHEQVFLLTKRPTYFYDAEAVRQPHAESTVRMVETNKNGRAYGSAGRQDDLGTVASGNFGESAASKNQGRILDPRGANLRTVWTLSPEPCPEAHFATFPSEIPRRCIAAGTSERGVCPSCGAPWRRVVERDRQPTRPGDGSKVYQPDPAKKQDAGQQVRGGDRMTGFNERWESAKVGNRDPQRHCTETRTVGWEPTCKCGTADPIPAVVLDPFGGAGTTLLVAKLMGRRGIAAELNPEYAEMARRRIARGGDLSRAQQRPDDAPLFDFTDDPEGA